MCFRDTACVVALLSLQQSAGLDSGIIWVTMASTATSFSASFAWLSIVAWRLFLIKFASLLSKACATLWYMPLDETLMDSVKTPEQHAWLALDSFFKFFMQWLPANVKPGVLLRIVLIGTSWKTELCRLGHLRDSVLESITDWRRCWLDHLKDCHKGLVAKYLWSVVNFLSTLLDVWMWHFPCSNNAMNIWPKWHLSADCMRFGHFL